MFDVAIKNGHVVAESGVIDAHIYVKQGRIAALSTDASLPAKQELDASDLFVLPGGVDPHVHFNDPGYTEGEDFSTGSAAAAGGGVTTVFEMPQTVPVTADPESFLEKKAIAAEKSVIDFALYLAIMPRNYKELPALMQLEPIGFKGFMSESPEIEMMGDGDLFDAMWEVAIVGGRLSLHCENQELIERLTSQLKQEGRNDPPAYSESRPPYTEWHAVERAVGLAAVTGAQLHVVHASTPEACDIVAGYRDDGFAVSVETTPHFLILDDSLLATLGPYAQCNPPLRDASNRDDLWERLADGTIDCVASDHAPFTFEEKEPGKDNIWESPAGLSGIQTMLPFVIGEGLRRGISWQRLAQVLSTRAAQLFGIYPKKGVIRLGSDADLVLFDPDETWTVRAKDLQYKQSWTPYEGMKVRGRVKRTLVRGTTVFVDDGRRGDVTVDPGFGKFIPGRAR